MGKEIQWLSFKTREQQQADLEAYEKWAFKYGEPQKKKIQEILVRLFPRETPSLAMLTYLLGRDAYYGKYDTRKASERNPLQDMYTTLSRKQLQVPKKDIPLYMALIIADERVTEALDYPPEDVLHAIAERLMKQE